MGTPWQKSHQKATQRSKQWSQASATENLGQVGPSTPPFPHYLLYHQLAPSWAVRPEVVSAPRRHSEIAINAEYLNQGRILPRYRSSAQGYAQPTDTHFSPKRYIALTLVSTAFASRSQRCSSADESLSQSIFGPSCSA